MDKIEYNNCDKHNTKKATCIVLGCCNMNHSKGTCHTCGVKRYHKYCHKHKLAKNRPIITIKELKELDAKKGVWRPDSFYQQK